MLKSAKSHDAKDPLAVAADLGYDEICMRVVVKVTSAYGKIDVLVNNHAEQHKAGSIEELDEQRVVRPFRTNVFGHFFLVR